MTLHCFQNEKLFQFILKYLTQNSHSQAYASYMKGNLLFEQEKNIEAAMINFKNTRFVEFIKVCPLRV
jgi:hypothetical protein